MLHYSVPLGPIYKRVRCYLTSFNNLVNLANLARKHCETCISLFALYAATVGNLA